MADEVKVSEERKRLLDHGGPPEVLDKAEALGIPLGLLFQLLAKYGPQLWAILAEILAAVNPPLSPVVPEPLKPAEEEE